MDNKYPTRVQKSEQSYAHWEAGDGDMGELAVGLYDLTAEYKALWRDYCTLQSLCVRVINAPGPEELEWSINELLENIVPQEAPNAK